MPDCPSETIVCGHWVQCQLSIGHGGDHVFSVTWTDNKQKVNPVK